GINLDNAQLTTSGAGSINLTAHAIDGGGNNNRGIAITNGSQLSTSGSGNISLTGTGGNGGAGSTGNSGVEIADATTKVITTGSGTIALSGTAGNGPLPATSALNLINGIVSTAGGTGTITLAANSMVIGLAVTVTAGTNNALLRQLTTGTGINIGGADTATTLGLVDDELDRITAGTLTIGDANSGGIAVVGTITHGNNLVVTTGAGITVGQAMTMAADKNLTIT